MNQCQTEAVNLIHYTVTALSAEKLIILQKCHA